MTAFALYLFHRTVSDEALSILIGIIPINALLTESLATSGRTFFFVIMTLRLHALHSYAPVNYS